MSDRPDQRQERASSRQSSSGDSSRSGRPGWRRDAFLQAGFLVGAALGAAATVMGRRMERSARRGLIDWRVAERIAVDRVRNSPGTLDAARAYRGRAGVRGGHAGDRAGTGGRARDGAPGIVERSAVVAREDWVRANVATFAGLIGKIEGDLLDQVLPPGSGFVKASMAIANRAVSTRQFGYLLGFLGQRVLGQYDLAVLSAETTPGRLLFLDENIRRTAASLGVPLNPFRTWIALHESTHAFEFEAHPWLRPYLAERLERQLTSLSSGVSAAQPRSRDAAGSRPSAARARASTGWRG